MEVVFWGLRDVRRLRGCNIRRPKIKAEIGAGKFISGHTTEYEGRSVNFIEMRSEILVVRIIINISNSTNFYRLCADYYPKKR